MATRRKIKTTTVKRNSSPKRVRDSKASRSLSPVHRKGDGGTLNPGPGKKK